ncbi:MAG TPA: baseplate J/gp47 family protein [bacterium]|nr:baseplate J/gp47 family protein [bacterium]
MFKTFLEIKSFLISALRSKPSIGSNFNLDDTEAGGQLLNIASSQNSDVQDLLIDTYNANTIFTENEQDQDIQLIRMGTKRIKAQKARIYNYKLICSGSCEILADTHKFQDGNGNQFAPVEDYSFTAGTQRINLIAVETGSIELGENELNIIVSPISGLTSATNDSESIFQNGRNKETIEEARERMADYSSSYLYTEDAVKKAVEELEYVVRAIPIYDDDRNEIEVIVEQSETSEESKQEVAETIAFSKAGGIKAVSSAAGSNKIEKTVEVGTKSETIIQYSLPTEKECHVRLTLDPELPEIEKDSLAQYIEDFSETLLAGSTLVVYGSNSLVTTIVKWAGETFTDIKIETSENGTNWTENNIEATALQIIRVPKENVGYL